MTRLKSVLVRSSRVSDARNAEAASSQRPASARSTPSSNSVRASCPWAGRAKARQRNVQRTKRIAMSRRERAIYDSARPDGNSSVRDHVRAVLSRENAAGGSRGGRIRPSYALAASIPPGRAQPQLVSPENELGDESPAHCTLQVESLLHCRLQELWQMNVQVDPERQLALPLSPMVTSHIAPFWQV